MLKVDNLRVSYGHIEVLKGISFSVEMGEIVALIGGNGAGKTTTLSTISGLLRPTAGTIGWNGNPIHTKAVEAIVASAVPEMEANVVEVGSGSVEMDLSVGSARQRQHSRHDLLRCAAAQNLQSLRFDGFGKISFRPWVIEEAQPRAPPVAPRAVLCNRGSPAR
jgi:ABC-type branched-subunit amino acid transport system ATPase component